ncbi:metallophosphoesterase [Pyrococcus kukulkanii]|uniref:metallophosphoesterase n=1 Tax=Pyrococcus kukulkanii TaxID=1609559 RepID=UPI000F1E6D50|nr:MAG: YfcE family phosphodiesterase [Thermococci archaeon]
MRVLAITDIHGNYREVKTLAGELDDFDVILIAGDITHFGNGREAEKILSPLLGTGKPLLAVMGNCDGRDVLKTLEKLGISVHNKRVEVRGVGIVGFGGSNVTPFSTIWEFSDEEIYESLRRNYKEGDIILTHAPPYGTKLDKTFSGVHTGSRGLRKFIEENQPPLCICGHIHEGRGVERIGRTIAVNPGPLSRGYYAMVDLEKLEVELKKIS